MTKEVTFETRIGKNEWQAEVVLARAVEVEPLPWDGQGQMLRVKDATTATWSQFYPVRHVKIRPASGD